MAKNIEYCKCCGQKIVEYKHKLNKGLVNGLYKLYQIGGEGKLKELNLTNNEFGNFQKLGYFGLVTNEGGVWKMTLDGYEFIQGTGKAPGAVYTVNGINIGEDEGIYINQVKGYYELKEEWQEQASRYGHGFY